LNERFLQGGAAAGEGKAAQMVRDFTVKAAFEMAVKGVGMHP
jgi:hypothetical protein